jgi:hypothetical protein
MVCRVLTDMYTHRIGVQEKRRLTSDCPTHNGDLTVCSEKESGESLPGWWSPSIRRTTQISQVADNRVREFFDTLHRDHDEKDVQSVIGVTHGEFIWAARLVLDYMFNEDYEATEADKTQKIHNCQVVHYTRISPEDGTQSPYLRWRRSVAPWKTPGHTGEWHQSSRRTLSNDELLAQVESLPRLFGDDS